MGRQWTLEDVAEWFLAKIPDEWFEGEVTIAADRDEILLTGRLAADGLSDAGEEAMCIKAFREATREARIAVAEQAEALWGRKVSWATECGSTHAEFTSATVPVMTRLRLAERQVLDTLIDAGVARSRSDALGWCVRLVGEHQGEWIDRLRDAMSEVEKIRAEGPGGSAD